MPRIFAFTLTMLVQPLCLLAGEPPQKAASAAAGVFATKINGVDVEIFIPDVKVVRGVIVHAANYGLPIKSNDRWADLGRELSFAHVAMRIDPKANNRPTKLHHALIEGLKEFAQKSGHPELATVPLAGVGHSAGGMVIPALHLSPERMLTACVDCGWVSNPEKWPAAAAGVPILFTMGAIPDAFKMLPSIEQYYDPARRKSMPWGLGLQWGCAHDFANAAALQAPWVRAIAKARISETDGTLMPIKLEDGWLGDRTSIDGTFATVASWSDYKGDRNAASWFPNREMAYIWRAWQSKNAPLVLEAASADGKAKLPVWSPKVSRGLTVDAGTVLILSATAKDGVAPNRVTYFAGDQAIGEAKSSPWTASWTPAPGSHAVWAQWEEADGKLGAANPALVMVRQGGKN